MGGPNTDPDPAQGVFASWADNRDVVEPTDGNWSSYTPPLSSQPGGFPTPTSCSPERTGMRNQNLYSSMITQDIVIGAPVNTKPLGLIQRGFVVYAQNTTNDIQVVRMQIGDPPNSGFASFLQFEALSMLEVEVAAHSVVARTVFVTSSDEKDSVRVDMTQINGLNGGLVADLGSVLLNPDPTTPNIVNPNIVNPNIVNPNIVNTELLNPNIVNPNIVNPNIVNPNIVNPNIVNPNIVNPNIVNPNIVNPNIVNPNIQNPNIVNPNIVNPNIVNPNIVNGSLTDVQWEVTNDGNTTAAYSFKMLSGETAIPAGIETQLLITRTFSVPVAFNCGLEDEIFQELMVNIINPVIYDPSIDITNPNIVNAGVDNATFFLAPGDTALVTLRVVDLDTTDGIPPFDPTGVGGATTPLSTNTVGGTTDPQPTVAANLLITSTTVPVATRTVDYATSLQAIGDGVAPFTWSVVGGALPLGITLDPSTGVLSGNSTTLGTFGFTVQIADSSAPANIDTQVLSLEVTTGGGGAPGPGPLGAIKLVAADAEPGDAFGSPLAISGDTAVVGLPRKGGDESIAGDGAAYVYSRSGGAWAQVAKLTAGDGEPDDLFGGSVAVHRDVILIGAIHEDGSSADTNFSSGAVYVFRRVAGVWGQVAKLTASDAGDSNHFGNGVAISESGDLLAIGALGLGSGLAPAVYVFRWNGTAFVEEAKIEPSGISGPSNFPAELSISGDTIAAADEFADSFTGAVYAFRASGTGWVQEAKLSATDAGPVSTLGAGLDVSGDVIVASTPETGTGAAYVFRRTAAGWSQEAKVVADDAGPEFGFGVKVALNGHLLAVSDFGDDAFQGAVYLFDELGGAWLQVDKIPAPANSVPGTFAPRIGVGLDFSNTTLIAGSPTDSERGERAGAAFVFGAGVPMLIVPTAFLPGADTSAPYRARVAASGGEAPYSWSLTGALPPGLSLDGATGEISGTATVDGTFNFQVDVSDSSGLSLAASANLSIVVGAPQSASPQIVAAHPAVGFSGQMITLEVSAATPLPAKATWEARSFSRRVQP